MMEIKEMAQEDLAQVSEIESQIFSLPWSEKAFEESLKNTNTLYIVAKEKEEVLGYIGMYISFQEGNITNVAVNPNYRRKKIGQNLIREILERAKQIGVTDVILEVRETNAAAICLYEKMGFEEAGIRKNFYEKPLENAIIMWKHKL
ncbi:ribosomal protein S18-alanine N-acetyltransferase [uncultured Eubacterium sp.]|uniref:ribosomal protein S18-alanine N-acetyltransferase n=1 Tax=uncultured Eubacterium sp. TaxID=165185 RepID=UPI002673FF83|nr:ribosomal protein S18-alanine N-acetyltransferase [uncultured Eubacterium sp.]